MGLRGFLSSLLIDRVTLSTLQPLGPETALASRADDSASLEADALAPAAPATRIRAWRWLMAGVAVAAVVILAARGDWSTALTRLGNIGYAWPLVLLPFAGSMVCATAAWQVTLFQLGYVTRFFPLLRLRVAAEAVVVAVPGGPVLAETCKPYWLRHRLGVPYAEGTASVALTKAFIVQAEGLYILLAFALAYTTWSETAATLTGPAHWVWRSVPLLGAGLLLAGMWLLHTLRGGLALRLVHGALTRVPVPRFRRWLSDKAHMFDATAGSFSRFFGVGGNTTCGFGLVFTLGQWLMEALETYVILRLLGVSLSFSSALLLESLVSTIRAAAFFLPAGLGAQEMGSFVLLELLGVPGAPGAATALAFTKRSKEVFWIVAAAALHFVKRR